MLKKGQITIFIIISIIIVGGIVLFFVFGDKGDVVGVHPDIVPVYENLLSCLFAKLSVSQPDAPSPVKPILSLERSGR